DAEHLNRRPSHGCSTDEQRPVPAEVPRPLVTTRVEEPCALARLPVDAREITDPVTITRETRPSEVAENRGSPVMIGDDVVGFKVRRGVRLRKSAVFATGAGPLSYLHS